MGSILVAPFGDRTLRLWGMLLKDGGIMLWGNNVGFVSTCLRLYCSPACVSDARKGLGLVQALNSLLVLSWVPPGIGMSVCSCKVARHAAAQDMNRPRRHKHAFLMINELVTATS
jgi:hypothetical protein